MIQLHRTSDPETPLWVNPDRIVSIVVAADTTLQLDTGNLLPVVESVEEVVDAVVAFRRRATPMVVAAAAAHTQPAQVR